MRQHEGTDQERGNDIRIDKALSKIVLVVLT